MTAIVRLNDFETGFSRLPTHNLTDIAELTVGSSIRQLSAGETLYVEGDPAPYCFEVVDGVMKEYNTLEDGRRQVADFYDNGELFGISELSEHLHTAEAVSNCTIRCHPRDAYLKTIAASPTLSEQFLDALMFRLHRARERMVMLGRMSAVQRVSAFLLRLSSEQERANDIQVKMSRQDIADHLGLTIETVCRVLTDLKKRDLIEMQTARLFTIPDVGPLEDITHGIETVH